MFQKITLKNNLRIIVVPEKTSQAVTVLALVRTGSKNEIKETKGISHFLEHLYFKGTKKRKSPLLIAEALDKIGGIYNAFTSEECTGYYAKTASHHFETAIDWVSDIYLNSLLPKKEIEKERKVIIEEINMYLDTPTVYINEIWKKLLYGDQPAGWDVAGTKESVNNISREQLISYMRSQYLAANTIICLSGNISASQAINKAKYYFSKIRTGKLKDKQLVTENQQKPEALVFFKETDQTHLSLGVRTFNVFNSQRFNLDVLSIILGGMMSSRLFIEIREKLGLAYYVKTESEVDPDTGYLTTKASVDNQRVDLAVSTILKEYRKISNERVSLSELNKAKENFKGKMALALESSDVKAFFFASQELLENRILLPKNIFKEIDKISQNDILKTAQEIFKPEKLNLALIGPFKNKEKFQKILKL